MKSHPARRCWRAAAHAPPPGCHLLRHGWVRAGEEPSARQHLPAGERPQAYPHLKSHLSIVVGIEGIEGKLHVGLKGGLCRSGGVVGCGRRRRWRGLQGKQAKRTFTISGSFHAKVSQQQTGQAWICSLGSCAAHLKEGATSTLAARSGVFRRTFQPPGSGLASEQAPVRSTGCDRQQDQRNCHETGAHFGSARP